MADNRLVAPREPQTCATDGCANGAAFRTTRRPAWCEQCLDDIYRTAGLRRIDPVKNYETFGLTECLTCGTQTHQRLTYVLDQNSVNVKTCRACHWTEWARDVRTMQRSVRQFEPIDIDQARKLASDSGFEYIRPLTSPSMEDDPHLVKCERCGKITAERLGDIAFGSPCSQNRRPTGPAGSGKVRFRDSKEDALIWWDHSRNDETVFETITVKARRKAWWVCPECHEGFEQPVAEMCHWPRCPACTERRHASEAELVARYKATPVSAVPMLMEAWDDDADPSTVMVAHGGWPLYRFLCPKGHHPRLTALRYLRGGCPHCRSIDTVEARIEAADFPEISRQLADCSPEIASQWHPARNGTLTAKDVVSNSKRVIWWLDPICGHEWQEAVRMRDSYQRYRCPTCKTILDSLAYQLPELAAEWSPANRYTSWQVRPFGGLTFVPEWICSANPEHHWTATLPVRTNGGDCPECREAGKSRVELAHHAAAVAEFGSARSGTTIRSDTFSTRTSWTADISVDLPGEPALLIEYDGAYWHAGKRAIDTTKTLDLLAAGHRVVRLREAPLPPLRLSHPRYLELIVHPAVPAADLVMGKIALWVAKDTAG